MSYDAAYAAAFDTTPPRRGLRLGPHTVTILRAPDVAGDYGTSTRPDWDHPAQTVCGGCSVQPAPSGEYTVDRDSTMTLWQVWLPPSADLRSTDRVEWNGQVYDVDGDVQRWDFPPLDHVVANLRRSSEGTT